ncbi:MAG: primosomal protein N' [Planctomycetaceae bacterium]
MTRQQQLFETEPPPTPWEEAARSDQFTAEVVFNLPLETSYHYLVPPELRELIQPGQRVRVPFGRGDKLTTAYCVGVGYSAPTSRKLKQLQEILDREPLLTPKMLRLTEWIANRYLCGWGQVLESVIPAGVKKQAGTREVTCYEPAPSVCEGIADLKLPRKQRDVLQLLCDANGALRVDEISDAVGCGTSPINSLRDKKLILPIRRRTSTMSHDFGDTKLQDDLTLNPEQQAVLTKIEGLLQKGEHGTLLLCGVTGSGKTEVYIQAIREVVSYGRQAIVLVPEISLTPQTIRRFRSRFPSVAVLHSHLSDAERHWHWQQIALGEVQVVVGARSAVFAPTPHLGLIVIDEEHETTFKQQTTPRYHAREVARERAREENIPLLLGSATPSLESLQRARDRNDIWLPLHNRVESRPLPPVHIVDVQHDPYISKGHSIGRALANQIKAATDDGGQVILFLNLRGYSTVLWCPKCQGIRCPDCDITLTWHRDRGLLLCHSCEYSQPPPEVCPTCSRPGMRYLGTGTQRLEAEVKQKFPKLRILRMDSDSMRKPGSHDEALESFRAGEVDLLLGTQMIAKGLDFPNVTLVGVVDADTLLHQPDLRASERTFQLIAQVAGRTGRGDLGGRVLVQTMSPDEPVIQFASRHDYLGFAKHELENREAAMAPPFQSLARIVVRGLDDEVTQAETRRIASAFREAANKLGSDVRLLGPAPAPVAKLKKHFRYHFLLYAPQIEAIQEVWRSTSKNLKLEAGVEMQIDVDPLDMR